MMMTASSCFAERFSLEAVRPAAAEIDALATILPPATPVYLTAVQTQPMRELAATAARVRKAGLEPVAHIAARRLASADELKDTLLALRGEADMRRILVIGGDVDCSGPFADALAVIQKGRLRDAGIEEIGIGGYPEGHPHIPAERLEAALDAKIATARAVGLRVHIVSQFLFEPDRVVAWLQQLRQCGIAVPVKVGMAGPTSFTALARYARRCGVNASLRGLTSGIGSSLATGLFGNVGPDNILAALDAVDNIGDAAPHYFSFGGVLPTARYACEAARGRAAVKRAMAR